MTPSLGRRKWRGRRQKAHSTDEVGNAIEVNEDVLDISNDVDLPVVCTMQISVTHRRHRESFLHPSVVVARIDRGPVLFIRSSQYFAPFPTASFQWPFGDQLSIPPTGCLGQAKKRSVSL